MKNVCSHCHTADYINGFYKQYDNFVVLYNEKFAKPGKAIMDALKKQGLITATPFDEEIEWAWFYLWHHEGRRARHGASMMAPDYAHWHGTYEVAERFYEELIPQAREIAHHAIAEGKEAEGKVILDLIDKILARTEHKWFEAEKKGGHKPAEEAKPEAEKPDEKKPDEKKPEAEKPEAEKPAEKSSDTDEEKKEDEKDEGDGDPQSKDAPEESGEPE